MFWLNLKRHLQPITDLLVFKCWNCNTHNPRWLSKCDFCGKNKSDHHLLPIATVAKLWVTIPVMALIILSLIVYD